MLLYAFALLHLKELIFFVFVDPGPIFDPICSLLLATYVSASELPSLQLLITNYS